MQAGIPVLTLSYDGFGVTGAVPVEEAFRLAADPAIARVQFAAGPGTAGCTPVPLIDATPVQEDASRARPNLQVLCLLESSAGIVAGLPAVLGLTTGTVEDVLVLPLTAVAGSAVNGQVVRVLADRSENVEVGLGLSDGIFVEITSGLADGDLVLPFGPSLRQAVAP